MYRAGTNRTGCWRPGQEKKGGWRGRRITSPHLLFSCYYTLCCAGLIPYTPSCVYYNAYIKLLLPVYIHVSCLNMRDIISCIMFYANVFTLWRFRRQHGGLVCIASAFLSCRLGEACGRMGYVSFTLSGAYLPLTCCWALSALGGVHLEGHEPSSYVTIRLSSSLHNHHPNSVYL